VIRKRRGWQMLAVLFALALVAAGCGGDDDDSGSKGDGEKPTSDVTDAKTITFAAEQEPTSLNYQTAEDNAAWTQYIMEMVWPYLNYYSKTSEPIPNEDLATAEVTSDDPQVITIKVNPEAAWSDGTDIGLDDFAFTAEAEKDCSGTGPYQCASDNGYKDIKSIEQGADENEIVVTFAKPYADWQGLWAPLLPKHAFEAAGNGDPVVGFNTGFKIENLAGKDLAKYVPSAGPYAVTSYETAQSMTLTRNDAYWGTPAVTESLVFPFITDATQQPAAFENGEADGGFPQAQIDLLQQLQGLTGFNVEVGFGSFFEHLDLNSANEHLAALEVRQALAKAIDREAIVDTVLKPFDDKAQVLNNRMFFPADERYEDHSGDYGKQDTEGAKTLLEKAGYSAGKGGIYEKDGKPLSLRIVWRDPNPRRQQAAELIQAQAKEAGFDIQLSPRPDFTFLDNGDFDIALFGWTGGTSLAANESIYVKDGGQNYTGVGDAQIQELFTKSNGELDADKRAEELNQIDQLVWDQMSTIPLAQNPEVLVSKDTLAPFEYNGYQGPTWNAPMWGAL
jgi:peptide/nickel transport system substrate-binding protein